ncbi:MAG: glucosamine-6-phosphate deaminase [Granulosicoccaceae bacterium]
MEVITRPSATAAVDLVARLLEARIRAKGNSVLGLATGRTMERVYEQLAASGVSFKACTSFNLDEYIGIPANDVHSYRHYMQTHFFSKIDIDVANTHVPDANALDLKEAAQRYEKKIEHSGGIDVQLLGIGEAGHIGFNEPLSSIMSRTRDKSLTPATRMQNAEMFDGVIDKVPKRALTMGVGTILDARELILLATGQAKAAIVAQAVEGPITSMVSASALQLHPNCKVIVDEDAATELKGRAYYDFVFENEPEWARYH